VKLTGERPLEGEMPSSLLALHDAGYRVVRERLGPGRLLDLGCGVGDYTATLRDDDRPAVGVDYDWATARTARDSRGVPTCCSDGAVVALRDDAFQWVTSSHLIEHFVDPSDHVAEMARLTAPGGTTFVLTPNEPADFENPFHVSLCTPERLQELLGRSFDDVTVLGLDGTDELKADFEQRRKLGQRMLKLDPFGLRHRLPRRWFVALHGAGRRVAYRWLGTDDGPSFDGGDFHLTERIDDTTLVLFAIARSPR